MTCLQRDHPIDSQLATLTLTGFRNSPFSYVPNPSPERKTWGDVSVLRRAQNRHITLFLIWGGGYDLKKTFAKLCGSSGAGNKRVWHNDSTKKEWDALYIYFSRSLLMHAIPRLNRLLGEDGR